MGPMLKTTCELAHHWKVCNVTQKINYYYYIIIIIIIIIITNLLNINRNVDKAVDCNIQRSFS